jgi:hypothetical protein
MGKPPRGSVRVRGGCSGSRHGMGGSGQRSSPACTRSHALGGPQSKTASTEGPGEDVVLTKGLWWPELQCRAEVDDGRAAEAVGIRGEGRRRRTPERWAPWIASGGSCEGAAWVKRARGPPAASNCAAAVLTCGGLREKFRPKNGPGSRVKGAEAPG